MITVCCHHELATAAVWRDAIDALNLASERPDPFSSLAYYAHCLRYPADADATPEPWLLLALDGDALLGCLALQRCIDRVLGWPVVRLTLLTAHRADRPRLLARPADAPRVAAAMHRYLRSRQREWSLLEFPQQDAQSVLGQPADVGPGHCCRQWPNEANASIALRWPSVADYVRALSRRQRAGLQRSVRLMAAAGRVHSLSSDDPQLTPRLFRLYRDVERQSWKAATPNGFDQAPGERAHYRALLAADAPMRIRIDLLMLDGRPIAGLISGHHGDSGYALHVVYDERHADLAPGTTMLFLSVQRAIAAGDAAYHLLWGYGYYKRRWLAELTDTESRQVYRRGRLPLLRRQIGDLGRRLRGVVPQPTTGRSNPARIALRRGVDGTEAPAADGTARPMTEPRRVPRDDGHRSGPSGTRRRQQALMARHLAAGGESLTAAELQALVHLPVPGEARRTAGPLATR